MSPSVYLETSVLSYLVARPSRDLVTAAHQQITAEWWANRRPYFAVYVSELVIQEAGAGNSAAARRRLEVLEGVPLLDLTEEARLLGRHLTEAAMVAPGADADALHIAVASLHGMEYLVPWNCRYIANAEMRTRIERECRQMGYEPPILRTPEELMGGLSDDPR